jgi:hypothetical protein
MFSSGTAAATTANDAFAQVNLTYDDPAKSVRELTVVNNGPNGAMVRFDGGQPHPVPGAAARTFKFRLYGHTFFNPKVEIANLVAGSNITALFISGF